MCICSDGVYYSPSLRSPCRQRWGTCFTGNVFQGLQSTKSVLSRETAPLQFTKRSKTSARWQSDFHIYQHLRFTLLLTVLTGTDVYLCGEEPPGKLYALYSPRLGLITIKFLCNFGKG